MLWFANKYKFYVNEALSNNVVDVEAELFPFVVFQAAASLSLVSVKLV